MSEKNKESKDESQNALSDYRKHLQSAEQKSQEDFDKTVLSLSGGALGISFVFLKDVIGPNPIVASGLLLSAWVGWGASTFCVLVSYYLSHLALRKAIHQIDSRTIHEEKAGGWFTTATAILNASGAVLFFLGVIAITLFVNANLKNKEMTIGRSESPTVTTAAATAASGAASAPTRTADRKGASDK